MSPSRGTGSVAVSAVTHTSGVVIIYWDKHPMTFERNEIYSDEVDTYVETAADHLGLLKSAGSTHQNLQYMTDYAVYVRQKTEYVRKSIGVVLNEVIKFVEGHSSCCKLVENGKVHVKSTKPSTAVMDPTEKVGRKKTDAVKKVCVTKIATRVHPSSLYEC